MFRTLLGSRMNNAMQPARLRYLKEYVCLREASNTQAQSEQIKLFQDIAAKYSITPQELTQMATVVRLSELDKPSNFPNSADYQAHYEFLELQFRDTPYVKQPLHQTARALLLRVPELAKLSNPARTQAATELAQIYLQGINIQNFISNEYSVSLIDTFTQRTEEAIQNLKKSQTNTNEIEQCLLNILANYKAQGGKYIGLIKSYVESIQGVSSELATISTEQEISNLVFDKKITTMRDPVFSEEDKEYAKNVDQHEFKQFLQEIYEKESSSGFAQNRYNAQQQKLVYESNPINYHVFRYQILAAVFGAYFAYLLYRGDAYYSTILIVPAVAVGFFCWSTQNQARRAIPIVRQILKNNDNTYEFVFQQYRTINRIENIAPQSVKLDLNSQPANELSWGRPTDDGYHVKVGAQSYIVPYQYNGNVLDFRTLVSL